MEEIEILKQKIDRIEGLLNLLIYSDRYVFHKRLKIQDGRNIELSSTTGTKIGTETTQKLAFLGSTPIVQRANSNQNAVSTTGATVDSDGVWGFTTQAQANAIITLENELRDSLVALGLIKGSV